MNHIPPRALSRIAVCTGALALTLATCSACVGASTPSNGSTGSAAGSAGTSPSASAPATGGGAPPPPTTAGGGATGVSSTSGAGSGGGSGGGPQACETQNLSAIVANPGAAAGSAYYDIVFKNIGNAPCTLYGYPGVSLGAGSPVQQVGQPASRNADVAPKIVTLIPNAHAFAVLQVVDAYNYPESICDRKPATELRVYPPNNSTLLYIPLSTMTCASKQVTLGIAAVQPGTGS